jgi:hypothetical protein
MAANIQVASVLKQIEEVDQSLFQALSDLPRDARGFPARHRLFTTLRNTYSSAKQSIASAKAEYVRNAPKNANAKANEEQREREMNARAAARARGNDNSEQYAYSGYSSGPHNRPFGGRRTRRNRNKRHTRRH